MQNRVGDSAALSALKQDALEAATAQLEGGGDRERLTAAAYVPARAKVKFRFFVGCPRAMHGCPRRLDSSRRCLCAALGLPRLV